MSIFAILPVKSLFEVKTRLDSSLSQKDRSELAVELLKNSTAAVLDSGFIASCLIVSPDQTVLDLAPSLGAQPLKQQQGGLNDALNLGRSWAKQQGASHALILLPDLPLLSPQEISDLVDLTQPGNIVLAPDRHNSGTNGMLVETGVPFEFHFGVDSLRQHKQEALRLGLSVVVFQSPGTQFDVDTPLDLLQWRSLTKEAKIA